MKWIGKVAGGVLGAVVMGPIGAALGVLLGHQFDEDSGAAQQELPPQDLQAIGERFFRATFRVMGYLAKSDGRVSELEISAARAVMAELRLGAEQTREAIFSDAARQGFWIGAAHISFPGLGHVGARANEFVWIPAEYTTQLSKAASN